MPPKCHQDAWALIPGEIASGGHGMASESPVQYQLGCILWTMTDFPLDNRKEYNGKTLDLVPYTGGLLVVTPTAFFLDQT